MPVAMNEMYTGISIYQRVGNEYNNVVSGNIVSAHHLHLPETYTTTRILKQI